MRKKTWTAAFAGSAALALVVTGASLGHAAGPERSPSPQTATVDSIAAAAVSALDGEQARIRRGYEIAPVPLRLRALNRDLVGLGSYMVNAVGGCNDCHTNPSYTAAGDPFHGLPKQVNAANYLGGGQEFGPFVSRNLTPEPENHNRPAGLTLAQFTDVLRHGTDYDHLHPAISPLLQVMPWPTYQSMTDREIQAIYEYLRAIPHAEPGVTPGS